MTTKTVNVSGMTCSHCVAAVTDEVSKIDGSYDRLDPLLCSADLHALHKGFGPRMNFTEDFLAAYKGLVFQIRSEGVSLSDRRAIKMLKLFAASAAAQPRRAKIARGPLDAPFADMPLQLDARLVDMRLPLGRLAALKVGQVLPVSVARKVPLSIGGTVLAHGTLGEQDDRLALRVAETPLNPRPGSIPQANVQEVQA